MKTARTIFFILASLSATAGAQEPAAPATPSASETRSMPAGRIRVKVSNLRNSTGVVGIALFSTTKGFPEKPFQAMTGTSIPATSTPCVVVFDNIPYGTYAVSVLHDENSNGKMDKTFIGIPKEGFGTSNNPQIRRGPPSFDESQFIVNGASVDLDISMNYF